MDDAASELHIVIAQRSLDIGVSSLEGDVGESEELHVEFEDHAAHLDGGVAGLGIHAAHMGHADRKIHVPHDLGIEDIRDLGQVLLPVGLPVIERDIFQRRALCVRRREPVCQRVDGRRDILLEEDLLQALVVVGHPPAAAQGRHCLLGLDLISCEHPGILGVLLLLQLHIEFTEDLLEGLAHAGFLLLLEEHPLIFGEPARSVQCDGMRDKKLRVRSGLCACASELFQRAQEDMPVCCLLLLRGGIILFRCTFPDEHKPVQDSRRHRIDAQVAQFAVAVGVFFLHSPLKHCDTA